MNHQTYDILVVDDTLDNLRLLSKMLADQGYRVRPVSDGEQALKAAIGKPPDLILLDIMMPGMDGYEVCRHLKNEPTTADVPIIFLSALNDVADKVKAFQTGGVDYINKPFEDEEVLARVKTHLTLRQQQRELQDERERFRKLADAAFEGIVVHEGGMILDVNRALTDMFGYDSSELIGSDAFGLLTAESREIAAAHLQSHDESPYEVQAVKQDGTIFPAEVRGRTVTWQDREVRVITVRDMSVQHVLAQEQRAFRLTLEGREHFGRLVGKSDAMRKVYETILRSVSSAAPVVIYGETGTGKELTARTIFDMSFQHTAAFVPVNCASIPENLFESEFFGHRKGSFTGAVRDRPGYFEQAKGGTLFLDEVGELSLTMQAKLLRVLEDHSYMPLGENIARTADVRIIAATNRELRTLAMQGKIRSDFFHRLHVLAVDLPPLRWRKDDIPLLIAHFLSRQSESGNPPRILALPPDILEKFLAYDWPGNVRELFNEVQRYLTTGDVELLGHLPGDASPQSAGLVFPDDVSLEEIAEQVEQYYIPRILQRHGGNKSKVADILGLDRSTLYRKLRKYDLM